VDLSQNVDRETDRRQPGIVGCITPTGMPFLTSRGFPLLGLEALALQGLPLQNLLLTRETPRQLQDLAGNAMSSTVVAAAMLSALIAGHSILRKEQTIEETAAETSVATAASNCTDKNPMVYHYLELGSYGPDTVDSLTHDVFPSARLCHCELSTQIKTSDFFRCLDCDHTACKACKGNPIHNYVPIPAQDLTLRTSYSICRKRIQKVLPMTLILEGLILKDCLGHGQTIGRSENFALIEGTIATCLGEEVRFQSINRRCDWTVIYEGAHSRMELVLSQNSAQWFLFAKVDATEPVNSKIRQLLSSPIARMTVGENGLLDGAWELRYPSVSQLSLHISGKGTQIPGWENRLGLVNADFEERKVWTQIYLDCDDATVEALAVDIRGEYDLLQHCGTAMDSLHRQKIQKNGGSVNKEKAVYLFFEPDKLGRKENNSIVLAIDHSPLSHTGPRQVLARLPDFHLHNLPRNGQLVRVDCTTSARWVSVPGATLRPSKAHVLATCATPNRNMAIDVSPHDCGSKYHTVLECSVSLDDIDDQPLANTLRALSNSNTPLKFKQINWLLERAKGINGFDMWKPATSKHKFDSCATCVPPKPRIVWRLVKVGNHYKSIPYEDEEEAGRFERSLKARPSPLRIRLNIDDSNFVRVNIGLNISTLVHRAQGKLPHNGDISYHWRLATDSSGLYRPPVAKFKIQGNENDAPYAGSYEFVGGYKLRLEQRRSLTWMIDRDQAGTVYQEEEVEEALLPEMGWRVDARAVSVKRHHGGVIADAVGYGKTATILALISATRKAAIPDPSSTDGAIPINATLILVPPHLIDQWEREVTKFLGDNFAVVCVKDNNKLNAMTIDDYRTADIIIMAWTLFMMSKGDSPFLKRIQKFSECRHPPRGTNHRALSDWFVYAMPQVEDSVEVLKHKGLDGHATYLNERRSQLAKENSNEVIFTPSRRLRGKDFEKEGAERAARGQLPTPPSETMQLPSGSGPSSANSKKRQKAKDTSHSGPPPHVFRFERVVVDEFTYLEHKNVIMLKAVKGRSKWILSGTPPLATFAEVKMLASLIGVNLGIDDDEGSDDNKRKNYKSTTSERSRPSVDNSLLTWSRC
jgi:hypothetical protein